MNQKRTYSLLKRHEGIKLKSYLCPSKYWTCGCGHNLEVDHDFAGQDLSKVTFTEAQAELIFGKDLSRSEKYCSLFIPSWDTLDDVRQAALIDMSFMGIGKLVKFVHMLAAIAKHDWARASAEIRNSKWARDVKEARTNDVADMMLTGLWPNWMEGMS